MSSDFKPGDVVKLRSGGPMMTVDSVGVDDKIRCVWFDSEAEDCWQTFAPSSLSLQYPVKRDRSPSAETLAKEGHAAVEGTARP